ncbi:MAG: glutamate synthase subunit alpha, partial [Gammaproteobacteria bacterium]|nr:glutamate synthase subunit alpha [Gammaproteobacteria bacterium]
MMRGSLPAKQGLYDPAFEHDACGVGFVADIRNRKSHAIVQQGLLILKNLTHRGAVGADKLAGDGAGLLIQMPDAFLRAKANGLGFELPAEGDYGVGMLFLPQAGDTRAAIEAMIEATIVAEGQTLIGWRDVPTDNSGVGQSVKDVEPVIRQVFVARGRTATDADAFERKLFVIRKIVEKKAMDCGMDGCEQFYAPSFSSRTLNYKGMLLADQVGVYYPDLQDESMVSALALVHQRFSTNTFPSWDLAHPFRMIAHNGEINTLRGNVNWMRARRAAMKSPVLGEDLDKIWPLIAEGQSDSASFDSALELLVMGGYDMAHAMMMLIPEAWSGNPLMDEKRKAFYEYHAALMEPWDGPAAVAFTDGRQIGATLDRNGLRPARYLITDDGLVVMASEMGVLPIPEHKIVKKWRLQPGKMFLIDLAEGRIIDDGEIKDGLSAAKPYKDWLDRTQIKLKDLKHEAGPMAMSGDALLNRQQAFGYTQEDLKFLMTPMAASGQEAIGSMGNDNPPAVLSNKAKPLFNYFKQNFAQVTNPPIDPIREELVMSLVSLIGPRPNLLGLDDSGQNMRLEVDQPVLSNTDLERVRHIEDHTSGAFKTKTLSICWDADTGADGMGPALDALCAKAEDAVQDGYNIIVLSDRDVNADRVPIPVLLATSAVHHHLVRAGLRTRSGLVVESGAAREVHHFACLAGYGAEAVNPYLAFDTVSSLCGELPGGISEGEAHKRYIKAVGKGLLKVFSKMGISTYQSYCGAQVFDAVGLSQDFLDDYFTGTVSKIDGAGIDEVAAEAVTRHRDAFGDAPIYRNHLDVGGDYAYRVRGDAHIWTPESIANLQHAARGNDPKSYAEYSRYMNEQNEELLTLRGLFEFKFADQPIPLDEVEPASAIVKRFATGAMSYGSISMEAHSTLAIAMNQIGGKSNTGEGGEEPERFLPLEDGSMNPRRSAIKQVASGRFGVTAEYLVNSDDIQIKMAQGAKHGDCGQLPGHKVYPWVAKTRHSTPGVGL